MDGNDGDAARPNETSESELPTPKGGIDLPLFVYGALQPGEIAHHQIATEVTNPRHGVVKGWRLNVRDGLPLLIEAKQDDVLGQLIELSAAGYDRVRRFEPRHLYRWETVDVDVRDHDTKLIKANVLVGKVPDRGGAEPLFGEWSSARDPAFSFALDTARDIVEALDVERMLRPGPPDSIEFWDSFFRLEAAYLLLWTAVERFTALSYGPSLSPNRRITELDADPRFRNAVLAAGVLPGRRVVRSDNPRKREQIATDGQGAAAYWYQVRSNLSHRGKTAYRDAQIVHTAFVELHNAFRALLRDVIPGTASGWQASQFTTNPNFLMDPSPHNEG